VRNTSCAADQLRYQLLGADKLIVGADLDPPSFAHFVSEKTAKIG